MPDNKEHLSYLRFKNGSGKIFDNSEACERSFIDRASRLEEDSSVWHSKITASRIVGSVISDAVISNSCVLHSDVRGGRIDHSVIACELIQGNVRIANSEILGKSRVAHASVCNNVRFKDLTVKGSAVLRDWPTETVEGCHGYISRGVWFRPARIFKISPTITVTEGMPGFAFVHCVEYPIEKWLKVGNRYGAASNWTAEEIRAVRKVMHLLQRSNSQRGFSGRQ